MNFSATCHHSSHSSLPPRSVLLSTLPLHHWRLVNGLKRHSIGRCTPSRRGGLTFPGVGEMQFISAPDQLPAKRTSHPISRCWQHKKRKRKKKEAGRGWMCVEDGLVGREVLMDFRLVSQFLPTRQRWRRDGGGGETKAGKTNGKYTITKRKKGHMTPPLHLQIIHSFVNVLMI